MILGLRENLKGTVVVSIIVLFFILPMVISGVGSSWLGSVAGTDAAVVDGITISNQELRREMYMQKQRMLSQEGVDPSADYLRDENLRGPVLERLTQKAAVLASVSSGGMAASEQAVNKVILSQQDFQTDGKFDPQLYRSLLARIGSSPAIYKKELSDNVVLQQLDSGLGVSSFVTEAEQSQLVEIIYEQRSFNTVDIPATGLADSVAVTADMVEAYYQANPVEFAQAERVAIEYLELSVESIAADLTVNDEDVLAQYEQEVAEFDATPEYEIAHILIEQAAEDKSARLTEVQEKIAAGDDFAELAQTYSDDAGSKDSGGSLGVMMTGIFPEAFEQAVFGLEQGQVSAPIETDAGVHLIKVVSKNVEEIPAFDERKSAIALALKTAQAEGIFLSNIELLGELTFSATGLDDAAAELGMQVQTSSLFERSSGTGIAANAQVRNEAYGDEVLVDGRNSAVLELAGNRAVVLRVKTHEPEHTKPLEMVFTSIKDSIVTQKVAGLLADKAESFIIAVKSGADAEVLATELGYEYVAHDDATRSSPISDPTTRQIAFSAPVTGDETVFERNQNADGSMRVISITSKTPGQVADLDVMEVSGLATQLSRENSRYEGGAFQAGVIAAADINVH